MDGILNKIDFTVCVLTFFLVVSTVLSAKVPLTKTGKNNNYAKAVPTIPPKIITKPIVTTPALPEKIVPIFDEEPTTTILAELAAAAPSVPPDVQTTIKKKTVKTDNSNAKAVPTLPPIIITKLIATTPAQTEKIVPIFDEEPTTAILEEAAAAAPSVPPELSTKPPKPVSTIGIQIATTPPELLTKPPKPVSTIGIQIATPPELLTKPPKPVSTIGIQTATPVFETPRVLRFVPTFDPDPTYYPDLIDIEQPSAIVTYPREVQKFVTAVNFDIPEFLEVQTPAFSNGDSTQPSAIVTHPREVQKLVATLNFDIPQFLGVQTPAFSNGDSTQPPVLINSGTQNPGILEIAGAQTPGFSNGDSTQPPVLIHSGTQNPGILEIAGAQTPGFSNGVSTPEMAVVGPTTAISGVESSAMAGAQTQVSSNGDTVEQQSFSSESISSILDPALSKSQASNLSTVAGDNGDQTNPSAIEAQAKSVVTSVYPTNVDLNVGPTTAISGVESSAMAGAQTQVSSNGDTVEQQSFSSESISSILDPALSKSQASNLSTVAGDNGDQTNPSAIEAQAKSVVTSVYPTNVDLMNLYDYLLSSYDTRVRPKLNQSQTTEVSVFFSILNILDFRTSTQTFDILGYFYFVWKDDFLTWKPRKYSRLQWIKIPQPEVWTPQVMIANMYSGESKIGDKSDRVLVTFRGTVSWVPEATYRIICEVEIEYYPFDKQTCRLTFYVSDEMATEVDLVPDAKHNGVRTDHYIENSEWKLVNASVEKYTVYGVSYIDVVFTVERRLEFIFFTTVAPLLLLSVLNLCAFLIPVQSEEKGSYSVTIVITYGVFISQITASLPPNSVAIPYMLLYMIWLLGFSVSTVIYAIIQSRLFSHYGKQVVGMKSLIKCFGKKRGKSATDPEKANGDETKNTDDTPENNGSSLLCGDILRKLDVLMLVLYVLSISGTTAYFFCSMKIANTIF